MARKKQKKLHCAEMPPWMITFTDCMTLMLTFFVLLVSMSKVDERRKLVVLGSIIGAFGWQTSYDVLSTKNTRRTVEPGPMNDETNLETLKPMVWEDVNQDVDFQSNRFVQVLSLGAGVLFEPGTTTLSAGGRAMLDRILPVLREVQHPLLIAGHTASLRDELGAAYRAEDKDAVPDLSWKISLNRALAVYTYLVTPGGLSPDRLRVEAFGRFRPHYNNSDPAERMRNRRVDIVLDKRSEVFSARARQLAVEPEPPESRYDAGGFEFAIPTLESGPGQAPGQAPGQPAPAVPAAPAPGGGP